MADRNKRMEPRNLEQHVETLHSMVSQLVVPGRDSPWNEPSLQANMGMHQKFKVLQTTDFGTLKTSIRIVGMHTQKKLITSGNST